MFEQSRDELTAAVDRRVEELLAAAGCTQPPVDAIHIAQRQLGMVVCVDRGQPQRGRAQRGGEARHIYLRPEPTMERHQWTVAHEIGEHLKVELLERLGVRGGPIPCMAGESLANLFAHRLLVPTFWFADDAKAFDYDVLQLKERYRTASHEVVALRMLDLPSPCVISIVDNNHVSRRRSNAWRVNRTLAPLEADCQRHVHYYGRPHGMNADACSVWGWPVHRSDWKREILRTVFEE